METKFEQQLREQEEYLQRANSKDISFFERQNLLSLVGHIAFSLRSTHIALTFISEYLPKILNLESEYVSKIAEEVANQDANSNGFDIREDQYKILAEVKAYDAVGTVSGMRAKAIKKDLNNLLYGKKKAHLEDTSDYYKFFVINYKESIERNVQKIIESYDNVVIYDPSTKISKDYIYVIYVR